MKCSDAIADEIWKAVEKRMPKQNSQIGPHVQLEEEIQEYWLKELKKIENESNGHLHLDSVKDFKLFSERLYSRCRHEVIQKRIHAELNKTDGKQDD